MRWLALAAVAMLCGCASAPPPEDHEGALPPWYGQTVAQLNEINRQAESAFEAGHSDEAAAKVKQAQSIAARVLGAGKPTLEAAEATADLDDLYGRMLLANRNYGWAQMFFQKNRSRWKNWSPQTPETERRFKLAESEIAECDKHID